MALTESIEYDKIEIVGPFKGVQVRKKNVVKKDGVEIASSFERYSLSPDESLDGQPAEVIAICNAVWTKEVKDAWTTYQASLSQPSE